MTDTNNNGAGTLFVTAIILSIVGALVCLTNLADRVSVLERETKEITNAAVCR